MYCGPYALARYYAYFGDAVDSLRVASEMRMTANGVMIWKLVLHALLRGYRVTRYAGVSRNVRRLAGEGCDTRVRTNFTRAFLRELASRGPFVANIAAREYLQQVGGARERRTRSPCHHFLYVRRLRGDGYYECDDAYTLRSDVFIPEDMMVRMLRAHHMRGNILVLNKPSC